MIYYIFEFYIYPFLSVVPFCRQNLSLELRKHLTIFRILHTHQTEL